MDLDLDQFLRQQTQEGIKLARKAFRQRVELGVDPKWQDTICFLGTGGNPEAVSGQFPHTAGFIITLDNAQIYVDPGPGAVVRANDLGFDLGRLDGIYISHGHTDHYEGAESIIEGMCWAMSAQRGLLMATDQVLNQDVLISKYHQGLNNHQGYEGGPLIATLKAYEPIRIKDLSLTPIPAYHGGENYGFILEGRNTRIGYTSDTNYITSYRTSEGVKEMGRTGPLMDFQEVVDYRMDIKAAYQGVDILIVNITSHNSWPHRHITCLGLPHLLADSGIKQVILTHFNYCCVSPVDIRQQMAQYVQEKSGISCIPAMDGGIFRIK